MPQIMYEIRVVKITRPLIGMQTQETLYLARPTTEPDPGPVIAAFNPTLVLPLPPPPPPILLEAQATVEANASAAPEGQAFSASATLEPGPKKSWWRG